MTRTAGAERPGIVVRLALGALRGLGLAAIAGALGLAFWTAGRPNPLSRPERGRVPPEPRARGPVHCGQVRGARPGRRSIRVRLAAAAVLGLGLAVGGAALAFAYWTSPGSGAGSASASTLASPTVTSAVPGAGTVALAWSAVTAPPGSGTITYYVTRAGGSVSGNCPTVAAASTALSCRDAGLTAGAYDYTVTAVWHTWSATSSPATHVVVAYGALNRLKLSAASTSPTAGAADNLSITAVDAQGITVASYTGSHTLTFAGASSIGGNNPTVTNASGVAIAFGTGTTITFSAGVATVSGASNGVLVLYKAETASITVAEAGNYTSTALSMTVAGASISSFSLSTPAAQTAGGSFTVSITAKDTYGNIASYSGTGQCVTLSGPASSPGGTAPAYPAKGLCATGQSSMAFTNGVAAAVSVTLYNALASTVLTVTDTGGSTGSTGAFSVGPAALSKLSLSVATTTPAAGAADSLTLKAVDAYGNNVTSYGGSHTLTFSGASSIGANSPSVSDLSGNVVPFGTGTPISFASGVATVSGASNGVMRLYKAETASLTVAEAGNYTSAAVSVTVSAGSVNAFSMATPSAQVAGTPFTVGITALDAYGNTATTYAGPCVAFSGPASSPGGSAPVYPAKGSCSTGQSSLTFTNGVASSVSITLYNAASTVLAVADSGKTGSTGAFTVGAASLSKLKLSPASTTPTAGAADDLTITAIDAYGNTVPTYIGLHTLTFAGAGSSPGGTSPTVTNSTNTPINFGTGTPINFSAGVATASGGSNGTMRLYKAETASLTVAEAGNSTSSAVSVTVSAASVNAFTLSQPSGQTAGTAFTVSITAKDAYGNTATGYTGTQCVTFSGPGTSPGGTAPSYPAKSACSSGSSIGFTNGTVASVGITLYDASGSTVLTASDNPTSKTGSTAAFSVAGGAMSKLWLSAASTTPTIATADNLTITAGDAWGNTFSSYTGSHTLTFAGASSSGGFSPTVTNLSGGQVTFGSGTAVTFSSGVATVSGGSNGAMRLYRVETASITVNENGNYTSAPLSVTPGLPAGLGVKVQYRNHYSDTPNDQFVQPDLQVVNSGSITVDLSLVTVRYWFTRDGGATTFASNCWWYNLSCPNLSSSVATMGTPKTGADSYAEVAFGAGAGTLTAGSNDGGMMLAWTAADWRYFDDTNDYSYLANTPNFVDRSKVTAYYYGNLAWGTEP